MQEKLLNDEIMGMVSQYGRNLGLFVDDLKGNVIEYNSDVQYESSSCIKLFILFEYYRQIYEGIKNREDILIYEEHHFSEGGGILKLLDKGAKLKSKDLATLMIDISDNIATNMLIEYLGMDNIKKNIKNMGFHNVELISDFHFPNNKPVGFLTTKEYGLAFKKIVNSEIYTKEICNEMLEILKKQHYKDILTKKIPVDYKHNKELLKFIASKSGKRAGCFYNGNNYNIVNDGGIIGTKFGNYIITICINEKTDVDYFENNNSLNFAADISLKVFMNYTNNEGQIK